MAGSDLSDSSDPLLGLELELDGDLSAILRRGSGEELMSNLRLSLVLGLDLDLVLDLRSDLDVGLPSVRELELSEPGFGGGLSVFLRGL